MNWQQEVSAVDSRIPAKLGGTCQVVAANLYSPT